MRKLSDKTAASLGEQLRALRKTHAVSLDMLAKRTHIRKAYLNALEQDDYETLPDGLYVRKFIKAYARELKADDDYFLELYDEQCGACVLVSPHQAPRQRQSIFRFLAFAQFRKLAAFLLIAVAVLTFLSIHIMRLTRAPELIVYTPAQHLKTQEGILSATGRTSSESEVFVNGESAILKADGSFSVELPLDVGVNEIHIEAKRPYSKSAEEIRYIEYNPPEAVVNNFGDAPTSM